MKGLDCSQASWLERWAACQGFRGLEVRAFMSMELRVLTKLESLTPSPSTPGVYKA